MVESTTSAFLLQGGRISVNVRLCGSIPRKDMVVAKPGEGSCGSGGAPSHLRPVSRESLTGLVFASTNGPAPTLTKIAATAAATSTNPPPPHQHQRMSNKSESANTNTTVTLSAATNANIVPSSPNHNNTAMARGILTDRHQHQVFDLTSQQAGCGGGVVLEPPGWAVPASGESRLEVRPTRVYAVHLRSL